MSPRLTALRAVMRRPAYNEVVEPDAGLVYASAATSCRRWAEGIEGTSSRLAGRLSSSEGKVVVRRPRATVARQSTPERGGSYRLVAVGKAASVRLAPSMQAPSRNQLF